MTNAEAGSRLWQHARSMTIPTPGPSWRYPSQQLAPTLTWRRALLMVTAMTWCARRHLLDVDTPELRVAQTWEVTSRSAEGDRVSADTAIAVVHDNALTLLRRQQKSPSDRLRLSTIPELAIKVAYRITTSTEALGVSLLELARGYRRLLDTERCTMLHAMEDVMPPQLVDESCSLSYLAYLCRRRLDPAVRVLCSDTLASMNQETGHLDPSLVSILADALEDSEMPKLSPLWQHLRRPGPHYLGCWALDALQGKS